MKAHWGVLGLYACVLSLPQGVWSRHLHLIALSQSFLVDLGHLGARRQARFWW